MCVCVCVYVCVCVRESELVKEVCMCVCVRKTGFVTGMGVWGCVYARAHVCVCVHACVLAGVCLCLRPVGRKGGRQKNPESF